MIKNALFYIFSLSIICLSFVSCDDEQVDGRWESMKWNAENLNGDVKVEEYGKGWMDITVSGEGSFDLICTNYSGFWIAEVNYPQDSEYWLDYEYEWLKISITENTAHCEFTNVSDEFHKELLVTFTAGDIFYTIDFLRVEDFGPSGKWAPLKWKLENVEGDVEMENFTYHTNFLVEGNCSFELVCTNYEEIWFLPGLYTPWPIEDFYTVDYDWCHLSIQGNTIVCKLYEWDGNNSPGIDFKVTAGEINNTLYFYQKSVIHKK